MTTKTPFLSDAEWFYILVYVVKEPTLNASREHTFPWRLEVTPDTEQGA